MIRAVVLIIAVLLAQTTGEPRGIDRVPDLDARLGSLTPDKPEAYFLLGEEVAAEADDPEAVGLARTLYVLAFELDRRSGLRTGVAPSACLALADLARLEEDRRWLASLAHAIDHRYARPSWGMVGEVATPDQALAAATVLGYLRAGETNAALRRLDEPGVRELLERYELLLSPTNEPGAFERLLRRAAEWPCRECANERIVMRHGPDGVEAELCPTCLGNPGPALSDEELIGHLRLESLLLDGIHRSWAAQAASDLGAPLRDPDPEQLAPTFGVDPDRPYRRAGAWVDAEAAGVTQH